MIKVDRTAKPKILEDNETAWTQAIQAALNTLQIANNKGNQEALKKAKEKYRQDKVKDALEGMFNGKCAYCESKVVHVSWGDIEHFRPKDTFPLLAVEWENLLLGCSICNGAKFKGTKFPVDANGEPLLINPCSDEPNDHLEFEYDQITKKFLVVGKDDKGVTSIETYGLNRNRNKNDLLEERTKYLKKLVVLAMYYRTDANAKQELDEACAKESPYSAFARMIREKLA